MSRVKDLINEGPYVLVSHNPLPSLIKKVNSIRSKISKTFDKNLQFKLIVSNPQIPKLYALPKIHKPGNKMRQISSFNNSPVEKLAKWLVREFSTFQKFDSFSINNSFELVDKLQNVELSENEILVSFDVTALFPSIPINETLKVIENWLKDNGVSSEKIEIYIEATKLCMQESYFQFDNSFYKQMEGASMGNPLSPFIAEIFMSRIETNLNNTMVFPKVWIRYVDDIICIIKIYQLRTTFNTLNNSHESIKFTFEEEVDGKLPFLDLLLSRNKNKIAFDIYRKSTTTDRFITSDSHHSYQHKLAAFRSLVHRLVNIPLSLTNFEKEKAKIIQIAQVNGYESKIINNLIRSTKRKKQLRDCTSLLPIAPENKKRFRISFHHGLSEKLVNLFRNHDIDLIQCSDSKISRFLTSNKDKTPHLEKSGVYEIQCEDCDLKYIGSSRRQIQIRFKEHSKINSQNIQQSAIAKHIFDTGHKITINDLSLVHEVRDNRKLEIVESYYIQNSGSNLMNNDNGPLKSSLFEIH